STRTLTGGIERNSRLARGSILEDDGETVHQRHLWREPRFLQGLTTSVQRGVYRFGALQSAPRHWIHRRTSRGMGCIHDGNSERLQQSTQQLEVCIPDGSTGNPGG